MPDPKETAHRIAAECATHMVKEGVAAGLKWTDIALSCETAIAIVVTAVVHMADRPQTVEYASELIDTMTEHAHRRTVALMLGVPYVG